MTDPLHTIEALLFVSSKPLSLATLAKLLDIKKAEVTESVDRLVGEYAERNGGMRILRNDDQVQMVTAPAFAARIADFLKDETTGELTRPSLETLTIIAYRGPVTKPEIEQIRGVNCSLILRNLLMRGLIDVAEDKRLMQTTYRVSMDFLRYLGLGTTAELPEYARLNAAKPLADVLHGSEQPPAV